MRRREHRQIMVEATPRTAVPVIAVQVREHDRVQWRQLIRR
jgi:hypothetical protein